MSTTFADLGLPAPLVSALDKMGITEPFPVQTAAIPDALAGRDVSGKAPTGSGKTLAFGLPALATIGRGRSAKPSALILAPTRELAHQIDRELAPLARAMDRRVFAIYGGVGYGPQKKALRSGVDILVATPGRLEDLIEQRSVDLSEIQLVVLDEADRMADMGFLPAMKRILDQMPRDRQTLLFSATLDGDVAVLSRAYQRDPIRHEAASIEPETIDATHHFWLVDRAERNRHVADVIRHTGSTIVFTRTRHGADRLANALEKMGVNAVPMHGGRSQNQRTRALAAFTAGRAHALVATDVAARGIHIDAVATVIHFDPPADHKDYLHRSGRTGRAGASGTVVSMVSHDQKRTVSRLQRDLGFDSEFSRAHVDELTEGSHRTPSDTNSRNDRSDRYDRNDRAPRGDRGQRSERAPRRDRSDDRHDRGSNRGGDGRSLYVANIPWKTTTDELEALFARHGTVHGSTIITDRKTGRSRGFGFVEMSDARQAIEALNGSELQGRQLTVREARPMADRR